MKPDILSVATLLGARSETWLYRQISCLRRHKVHVLAYEHRNRAEYPHEPVTLLPRRDATVFRALRLATYLLGAERPALDFRERSVVARLLADMDLKIVQAHCAGLACEVREAFGDMRQPFIAWFYGSDVFRLIGSQEARVRWLAQTDTIFCCTSQALRLRAVELGCPPESVHVHYPGVEVPADAPRRSPSSRFRIVSVGRLVDCKDPVGLVSVAAVLRGMGVQFSWRHFGDGALRPKVEDSVRAMGLERSFRVAGERPHHEVLAALNAADVMVHNAVIAPDGARDAFGVALAEAAAQGLPIVSARVGGIPEIVAEGKTGFLVDEGALNEMAERVSLLWREPDLRARMGRAAHEQAMALFDADRQGEKLDAFYDGVITAGGFDASDYWRRRFRKYPGLTAVGTLGGPAAWQRWLYRGKERAYRRLIRRAGVELKGKLVLDFGCGTGYFEDFWERAGARKANGLDIVPEAIFDLRSAHQERTYVCGDLAKDPSCLSSLETPDIVTAIDVLYHIVDDVALEATLSALVAKMPSGGLFLFTDSFTQRSTAPHVHFRSIERWRHFLGQKGLELLDMEPVFVLNNRTFRGMKWLGGVAGCLQHAADAFLLRLCPTWASNWAVLARKVPGASADDNRSCPRT